MFRRGPTRQRKKNGGNDSEGEHHIPSPSPKLGRCPLCPIARSPGGLRKLSGDNDVITSSVLPLIPAMIREVLRTGPSAPGSRHHKGSLPHSHSTAVKNIGLSDAWLCPMAASGGWDGLVRRGRESAVRSRSRTQNVAKNISRLQPSRVTFRALPYAVTRGKA